MQTNANTAEFHFNAKQEAEYSEYPSIKVIYSMCTLIDHILVHRVYEDAYDHHSNMSTEH